MVRGLGDVGAAGPAPRPPVLDGALRSGAAAGRVAAALGLIALGIAALAGGAGAQATIFDFVTFDRIDYIHQAQEPGRALERADLGGEFATVGCSIGEDVRGCPYGLDAAAAFLPAGTRMYAVRGYTTDFRLAAAWRDRIFLYQAWRNPRARVGAELYDIAGRVRAIAVRRGELPAAASAPAMTVSAPGDVEALVGMVLRGAIRPPRPHPFGEPRYWLTFALADGTTLGRTYFAETGELLGGVVLPPEFRRILARYVGE